MLGLPGLGGSSPTSGGLTPTSGGLTPTSGGLTPTSRTDGFKSGGLLGGLANSGGSGAFKNFGFGSRDDDSFAFHDPLDLQGRGANQTIRDATAAQIELGYAGLDEIRNAREQTRADLSPFTQLGVDYIGYLTGQKNLADNPFFSQIIDQTKSSLFANQAARGKIGSGGTAEELQNRLTTAAFNPIRSIVGLGQASAAGQAANTANQSASIAEQLNQIGNVTAAGAAAVANNQSATKSGLLSTAGSVLGGIFASDRRVKRDIHKIGEVNGLPVYEFKYIWSDEKYVGHIAQEVQAVKPEAVHDINGVLHVDYGVLYAA